MKYFEKQHLISFATSDVDVFVSPDPRTSGQPLTVRVTYPYNFLVFQNLPPLIGLPKGSTSIPLSATTVMRME